MMPRGGKRERKAAAEKIDATLAGAGGGDSRGDLTALRVAGG